MDQPEARVYAFLGYRLDAVARNLAAPDGSDVPLTAKALDVLVHLVGNRERVVGKDELLAEVWPGRVVEENNLTQAVSTLRRALGTGAGDHRFIVTVPGRGYRFVAELEDGAHAGAEPPMPPAAAMPARPSARALPIAALAIMALLALLLAMGAWKKRPRSSSAAPQATLAVLPFRAVGTDGGEAALDEALVETLVARLSRIPALRVLPAGTTERFAERETDPLRAGMSLRADYVVEGSIQRRGEGARINARLLSLPDGRTLWAGTVDQPPGAALAAQDALAAAVFSALSARYAGSERNPPCLQTGTPPHHAYARGEALLDRPTPQGLSEAQAAFEDAARRDPTCARAHAGIATVHRLRTLVADAESREAFALAYAAIERALEVDPESAHAHAAKGYAQLLFEWDWPAAEASLRHALALDPESAEAHLGLAQLHNIRGRHQGGLAHARRAVELKPSSPWIVAQAAFYVRNAGFVEEGRRLADRAIELAPGHPWPLHVRARMAIGDRDLPTALRLQQEALDASGGHSRQLMTLAIFQAAAGRRAEALRALQTLEARETHVPETSIAQIKMALGDHDGALDLLEQGYRHRDPGMALIRDWFPLYGQPRFGELLRRMALQETGTPTQPEAGAMRD